MVREPIVSIGIANGGSADFPTLTMVPVPLFARSSCPKDHRCQRRGSDFKALRGRTVITLHVSSPGPSSPPQAFAGRRDNEHRLTARDAGT